MSVCEAIFSLAVWISTFLRLLGNEGIKKIIYLH